MLREASQEFEVLLTGDHNLAFQQNLTTLPIAVIVMVAVNNRIETLCPLIPDVLEALRTIQSGQLVLVGA
ncbi:MAG: hypothetical protein Q8L40_05860 [Burkholderiales bacterium]|nr:hypothetical protein [Burkholderiales bacterium]